MSLVRRITRNTSDEGSRWPQGYDSCLFFLSDSLPTLSYRHRLLTGDCNKYSGRENTHLEESVDERLQDFLNLIRSKYISSDRRVVPMDLAKKVQYFTLDVISSVGLGKTFGMLQSDRDVNDYLQSSEEGLAIGNTALAMGFGWITQAPFIGRFIAPSPKDNNGFGKMMATCFRLVDERAASPADERSDMLASFMRHGLAGDELRTEALEQIIAGSDTTAGAIRGALLHLMTNPRVYLKLQREVDDAVRRDRAPSTGGGLVTAAQARQLPYLQAVIREALRVWPPVANIFSRDVPTGGDTVVVDGESVFLPGGVCIGYSAYAMHQSEKIYGKDAKAFRPERWLQSDPAMLALMIRTNDLMFGHGKFQCLGKAVAQIEIGKTVFEVSRKAPGACYHLLFSQRYANGLPTEHSSCATSIWRLSVRRILGMRGTTSGFSRSQICMCK